MVEERLCFKLPSFIKSFNLEYYQTLSIPKHSQFYNCQESSKLFIVISVSGAGRSTLLEQTLNKLGNSNCHVIKRSTTREPRDENENMNFYSKEEFMNKVKNKQFLYYLKYQANSQLYGLEYSEISSAFNKKRSYYFIEDTPSSTFLKKYFPMSKIIFFLNSTKNIESNLHNRDKIVKERQKRYQQSVKELKIFSKNIKSLFQSKVIHSVVNNSQPLDKIANIINNEQRYYDPATF